METGKTKYRGSIVLLVIGIALLLAFIFSFALGRYPISPKELLGILFGKPFGIEPFWEPKMETVLLNIRLPRILLACLVGSCLSVAGAAYQGIFQNPMAAPDVLGASTGATFGAALAILLYLPARAITINAFLFSILAVALVYFIGKKAKGKRILGLILAGIMVSSLFSAGTSFLKLVADPSNQLPAITYWMMGSLSGAKMQDVTLVIFPMAIGLLPLVFLRWKINILTLGDEEARTMGINAKRLRVIVILCATLITAASVSVSGLIGFVGLVIPHLCRRLGGNNYKFLIPASMLMGALFLLIVDNISRNALATEIPIGILTAFIGAPFFLYLIVNRGDHV